MASVLQMLPMVFQQNIGPQVLKRTPEPDDKVVTNQNYDVEQYDEVMSTKLAINYAIGTEAIYRSRLEPFGGKGLDIASGPGHMSLNMTRDLKLDSMLGIDLSKPMVATASKNANDQGVGQARFELGNATDLSQLGNEKFDLCTMMDAAHHLPTLEHVSKALTEMERVTHENGLIVVMDLVRLRTEKLTNKYVNVLGEDYRKRGLADFYNQFHDSMHAAWTADELLSAVPKETNRKWVLLVPRGLPFAQFLFGLPHSQKKVFLRRGTPWKRPPVRSEELAEYKLASIGLGMAKFAEVK